MSKHIIDTNTLMDYPECLQEFEDIRIPICILEELDNINHNSENENKKFKARQALRALDAANIEYIKKDYIYSLRLDFDKSKVDNRILAYCKDLDAILVTQDRNMIEKAKALDIEFVRYGTKIDDTYTGWRIIDMTESELANWYESEYKANIWDFKFNEYMLIRVNDEIVDRYRWTESGFVKLKIPNIKGFKPLNDIQMCAFDLVHSDVPIKLILGKVGSGKTIINARYAVHAVEKGKFQRVIYIHNPIGRGENIGFLPGNKLEKLSSFSQGFIDNLDGGEQQFEKLIAEDKLTVEAPYFIKGASKESSWFCVDEAEDLDVDTLKLLGTRLAKNSVICLSGDLAQTEKKYRPNNGLSAFINKFKGNPLVGIVQLQDDVRSDVSRIFGEL